VGIRYVVTADATIVDAAGTTLDYSKRAASFIGRRTRGDDLLRAWAKKWDKRPLPPNADQILRPLLHGLSRFTESVGGSRRDFEGAVSTAPLPARGWLVLPDPTHIVHAEKFLLGESDADVREFRFRKSGVAPGGAIIDVNLIGLTTAVQVAEATRAAVQGAATFTVSASRTGAVVALVNDNAGADGNVDIVVSVASGRLLAHGMSGGRD
jgi:hypothetical protein